MKNKIKLFDKLVYIEMLNQIKITGIIASAIYFVVGIITSFGLWVNAIGEGFDYVDEFPGEFFYILLPLVFIFVPIMAKSVFTYQNRRNASDFYHALPIKRECMFVSSVAAIVTWAVGIMLISTVLPVITVVVLPQFNMDFVGMFKTLGNIFAMSILTLGAFSLGINLTGNNFTNVIVSLMIIFVPRMISSAIQIMIETIMPFLVMNTGTSLVNNSYNLIYGWLIDLFSVAFGGELGRIHYMASWGYTVILGVIYLVLGILAHKHRKSEMAAQASAFKLVQPVTRMIPAYLFGLIGIWFFQNLVFRFTWENNYGYYEAEISYYWGMSSMIILSLLAYVIYELITTRRWKKVAHSLKQLPIFAGIIVGTAFLIWGGTTIALKKDVEADKMKYIEVGKLEGLEWIDKKGNTKITDDEVFEIIENAYDRQMECLYDNESYWESYEVSLGINQGGVTFYRVIHLNSEEMEVLSKGYMEAVDAGEVKLKLPSYNESKMDVDIYNNYFDWDVSEVGLYKALREDLKEVSYLEVIDVSPDETICELYIYVYSGKELDIRIPISKNTPRAYEYILQEATFYEGFIDEKLQDIYMITDEYSKATGSVEVYGYLYMNSDEIKVNPSTSFTIDNEKDLKLLVELLERFQDEDGDTLFAFGGEIYYYIDPLDSEGWTTYEFSKRIPKDLADEFMELFAKCTD